MSHEGLKIGVLLTDPVQLLDLAPIDLFNMATPEYLEIWKKASASSLKNENAVQEVTATSGVRLTHTTADEEVSPGNLDLLFLPGPDPNSEPDDEVKEFLRAHNKHKTTFLVICTAAFVAGYSGIYDSKHVTGPRFLIPNLRKLFPKTEWDESVRWKQDGHIWTAGGITNGNDLVAAYIRATYPSSVAETVCTMAEVGDRPMKFDIGLKRNDTIFPELQRAALLSSAAYSGCIGSAFDINITKQIRDIVTDTQGYIGYSEEKKRIAVVMRGSTAPMDLFNDLDTVLVTPKLSGVDFPPDAMIMSGINIPWSAVHDEVIMEVKRLVTKYPDYTLESTGHSLGGALTYLSYVSLCQNFPDKAVTSNALAAFPIGNQAFADFGSSQHGTLNRGNNALDGVPNIYVTPFNFAHYGTEFYSDGSASNTLKCINERDMDCSAGNGMYGITPQHVFSFGVLEMGAGCGSSL
ncbi:Lipase [Talaromyces islandicus]|uniref:Lipase n=1 Tax=Talaromyces islandicus TaxID=28573 RepID=A0A0U1M9A7_TALIS|nr:Lipase [Talaromyces islandicus]